MKDCFICVQKCPELDKDGVKHCTFSGKEIREMIEYSRELCPCGNEEKLEKIK